MRQRGYWIRFESRYVVVEHRAAFRPKTILILSVAYVCYLALPGIRRVILDFVREPDPVIGCFLLFFFALPFLSGATWLFFRSGEVFRCDTEQLSVAQRRTIGQWHRKTFLKNATTLGWTFVFRNRGRSYEAVTVTAGKGRLLILEELAREEARSVLIACGAIGWNVTLPESPPTIDDKMMKEDICRNGWLVNPWRPDPPANHPKH